MLEAGRVPCQWWCGVSGGGLLFPAKASWEVFKATFGRCGAACSGAASSLFCPAATVGTAACWASRDASVAAVDALLPTATTAHDSPHPPSTRRDDALQLWLPSLQIHTADL